MAKSTYLQLGQAGQTEARRKDAADSLPGGLALGQFDGACHSPSMQPSVGVNTQGLSFELLQLGWPLDRFEQGEKSYERVSERGPVCDRMKACATNLGYPFSLYKVSIGAWQPGGRGRRRGARDCKWTDQVVEGGASAWSEAIHKQACATIDRVSCSIVQLFNCPTARTGRARVNMDDKTRFEPCLLSATCGVEQIVGGLGRGVGCTVQCAIQN